MDYGVVVDSVKVSALEYVPVRRASLALTSCENSSVTASLEIGAVQLSRFSGEAEEPTLAYVVLVLAALRARTCRNCGRGNAPLTRGPGAGELGSATLSCASPAVETTLAVAEAR